MYKYARLDLMVSSTMSNVIIVGSAATAVFVICSLVTMASLLREIADLQMEVQVSMDEYKVDYPPILEKTTADILIYRVSQRTLGIAS